MRYQARPLAAHAVRLRCADINNDHAVDGPLFNQQPTPEWVIKAAQAGDVKLHRKRESDWAHLAVVMETADEIIIGPGDYLVAINGKVFPCPGEFFDVMFSLDEEDGA